MATREAQTDILIMGAGVGGVAGALAALKLGRRVILTEETDWIGGQLTVQAVPLGLPRSSLSERSGDDVKAAAGLHRRIGIARAVRPDRRGPSHDDPIADPHRPAEPVRLLIRRPARHSLPFRGHACPFLVEPC